MRLSGTINKVLIIKFKHIGDVLLSIPTLNAIKETYANATVDYLVNKGTEAVIEDHSFIREVYKLDKAQSFFEQVRLIHLLRKQKYDLIVDLSGGGDRGALWSFAIGAKNRIGTLSAGKKGMMGKKRLYTHNADTPSVLSHAVIRDLEIVKPFGITTKNPLMDLHIPKAISQKAIELLGEQGISKGSPYILIHPTSRWLFKCINNQVMADVIDQLDFKYGYKVVLTCGPDQYEKDKLQEIKKHINSNPTIFEGNISLPILSSFISGAKVFLGVDSAPAHIAAALRVPAVVIFGPTGAYNWGPWPNDPTEQHPYQKNHQGITRAGNYIVLKESRDCIPCGRSGCDNKGLSDCLESISSEKVLNAVIELSEKG